MRLPPNTSDDVDEDPTGNKALWDRGLLNGASQKVRYMTPIICGRRLLYSYLMYDDVIQEGDHHCNIVSLQR